MLEKRMENENKEHTYYIKKALDLAQTSDCDVPVAALVIYKGKIIAESTNKKEFNQDATAHAEMIVLRKASEYLKSWRLNDCSLYVTLEPCPMCASAIIYSRVKSVIFSAYDNLYGSFGSVLNMCDILNFHKPIITGGIEENVSRELLRNYFLNLRNNKYYDNFTD